MTSPPPRGRDCSVWDTRLDRCVISGMSQSQKIRFVFGVFDFDESGLLTVDEMILALRSTISGLCKLSGIDMPPETEIERIAVGAFANAKSIAVCKSNLQPDFNVRVFECFDTSTSAVLRELAKSNRFVQKSAESTSI